MALKKCPKDIWEHGEHIATIIDLEPEVIDAITKVASKSSGQRINWFFVGGRAAVKMIGDIEKGRKALEEALEFVKPGYFRFTTNEDSVLPFPLTK